MITRCRKRTVQYLNSTGVASEWTKKCIEAGGRTAFWAYCDSQIYTRRAKNEKHSPVLHLLEVHACCITKLLVCRGICFSRMQSKEEANIKSATSNTKSTSSANWVETKNTGTQRILILVVSRSTSKNKQQPDACWGHSLACHGACHATVQLCWRRKNASIQLVACYNHPVPATAATKASYMHDLVPCLLNSSATLDPLACFLLLLLECHLLLAICLLIASFS